MKFGCKSTILYTYYKIVSLRINLNYSQSVEIKYFDVYFQYNFCELNK